MMYFYKIKQNIHLFMSRLPKSFYIRDDAVRVSRELIGKKLVTCFDGKRTAGMIIETEAYLGGIDRASHAYGLRRTARTEVMYAEGGLAYVYLCYGIHQMFNVVASPKNRPHAILIRALEPLEGTTLMLERCKKPRVDHTLTAGPGNLTRALGISTAQTGMSLIRNSPVWIEDGDITIPEEDISVCTRVGVAYAGQDALLPYRFLLKGNPYLSKGKGL
jgi:DNA-3-methyladenine glycosylase